MMDQGTIAVMQEIDAMDTPKAVGSRGEFGPKI